ncbi:hypothetical protein ASPCAL06249 [Aspergillus calidoustus]|uniref:Uncharacterized protein n=1 Tax=Aspergillus calidoustus TaxID=454130 RepID=A0A0U5C8U3_ASPCI|nr:hypothetical protein ASPCAL06249 [Aspergillus calidoustus]
MFANGSSRDVVHCYRVASVGMPRDHHAIFVEVNDDQSGHLFQVVGNIQNGMTHGHRPAEKPEEWIDYQGKIYIGRVSTANYSRIQPICDAILPPKKQFEGPRRLYPAEPIHDVRNGRRRLLML